MELLARQISAFGARYWLRISRTTQVTLSLAEAVREGLTVKLQQSRSLMCSRASRLWARCSEWRGAVAPKPSTIRPPSSCVSVKGYLLLLAGSLHKRGGADMGDGQRDRPGQPRRSVHRHRLNSAPTAMSFRGLDELARARAAAAGRVVIGIAQSNQPLDEVTTPSVEALKLYTSARGRITSGVTRTRPSR